MNKNPTAFLIAQLIYKSMAKIITPEEKSTLEQWLSREDNRMLYNKIIDQNNIQDKLSIYDQIDTQRIYKNLERKIRNNDKRVRLLHVFRYAAVFAVLFGMGFLYQSGYFSKNPALIIPDNSITLQLENGTVKILKEDGASEIVDSNGKVIGVQNGTQIAYGDKVENETLVYNTLTVPYGKRFEVQLSDGTNVHLNAGTSLKYPVKFIEGNDRRVFLTGEAFFDVAKDREHPFIVNSGALNVQVLGTQFNVSGYPEDTETDVVLVEGSVNLYTKEDTNNHVFLTPGFKGSYNKKDTNLTTSSVITAIYTSWIEGELVFRNITFDNILKKLERHYNVEIVNNNTELANEMFNASFRNEPIEIILDYFKITYNINIRITDNKIIIS
jgi:hypothetical protein